MEKKIITRMGSSVNPPLSSIGNNTPGSEKQGESIGAKRRESIRVIILITRLKSKARAHETMNAGSTK